MEKVKVQMETRFFIECPNGCEHQDVDSYENSVFVCTTCDGKWEYSSEPGLCEQA